MFKKFTQWGSNRLNEESTAFGILLMGIGIVVMFPSILKLGGVAIFVYGFISVVRREK